jgi:hypothetical protein
MGPMVSNRSGLFAFILSVVRDFALAERIMREPEPREAVLRMSRGIALTPAAIAAVDLAAGREPESGWLEAVELCLDEAGGQARSILAMRYRDGMSGAEIARRTKTTATAVHEALSRARASLARCVEGRVTAP